MPTETAKTAYSGTLTATDVQIVQLTNPNSSVRVTNHLGTDPIYFTVNGDTPTTGGANEYVVGAIAGTSIVVPVPQPIFPGSATGWDSDNPAIVVSMISAGNETYTVSIY